jgi:hypothetical protein
MMAEQRVETKVSVEDRLFTIYGELLVLNERSTEVNRRVGTIEKHLEARVAEASRLAILENTVKEHDETLAATDDKKSNWWTWTFQFLIQTIGTVLILAALLKLGVPIIGG